MKDHGCNLSNKIIATLPTLNPQTGVKISIDVMKGVFESVSAGTGSGRDVQDHSNPTVDGAIGKEISKPEKL